MKTVIALGFFDGVHLGHGALLRRTAERARALGAESAVFTFDRPPKEVVTGVPVPLINSAAERQDIIRRLYDQEGQFLCLSRLQGGVMTSVKNFFGSRNY